MTSTAILFFSRSAEREARHKGLDIRFGAQQAKRLTGVMIDSSLRAAVESGLDVHEYTDARQVGTSFGERLANAFSELYALGYDRVISIGGDSPGLTSKDLLAAAEVKSSAVGFGPSSDGGVYLMSIPKEQFDHQRFILLPWETSSIRAALYDVYCATEVVSGRILTDVDSSDDIKAAADTAGNSCFSALVAVLIGSARLRSVHLSQRPFAAALRADLPSRAPPSARA